MPPLDSRKVGVTILARILVFSSNSSHLTNALLRGASNNFQSSYLAAISLENTQEHEVFTFTRGALYITGRQATNYVVT